MANSSSPSLRIPQTPIRAPIEGVPFHYPQSGLCTYRLAPHLSPVVQDSQLQVYKYYHLAKGFYLQQTKTLSA
jgi:hypothetical protein